MVAGPYMFVDGIHNLRMGRGVWSERRQNPLRANQNQIRTEWVACEVWRADLGGERRCPKESLCRGWYRPSNLPRNPEHSLMLFGGKPTSNVSLLPSSQQDSGLHPKVLLTRLAESFPQGATKCVS